MAQAPFQDQKQQQQHQHGDQKPSIIGIASNKFDPIADAKLIRNALKGAKTDEKAIIKVLTTRSNRQLQVIRKSYGVLYEDKDLLTNIKDETSGDFEKVCMKLLLPRADYDAQCLHAAMSGLGTNEGVLIEILCTRTAYEISEIIKSYDRLYDKSLEKIVKSEVKGDLQKILMAILKCQRCSDDVIDANKAQKDAEILYASGEKKFGTDEEKFIEILTTRSYSQITLIANAYEKLSKKTLIAALQSELIGDFEKACVSIVEYSKDPSAFWARKLKEAMKGIGTDDEKLIRIMIARAEHDLASIRNVFGDRYGDGRTLMQWIDSDCSGSYQMALQGLLLGNEQQ
jgi:hypothetical protein